MARMTAKTSLWQAGDRATLVAGVVYLTTTQMVWLLVGALGNYIAGDLGLNAGRTDRKSTRLNSSH